MLQHQRCGAADPHGYLAIKLGGSILTDRDQHCAINQQALHRCARAVAHYCQTARRLPLVFLGGGSFAHPFAHQIAVAADDASRSRHSMQMAAALEDLRQHFAGACRAVGLNPRLWRETDLFGHDNIQFVTRPAAAQIAAEPAALHVLTGGSLNRTDGSTALLSSDDLAVLLCQRLPIARFAILTDVAGVIDFARFAQLVADIPAHQATAALQYCGANKESDMTGGMNRKLQNCIQLVQVGIPCYVGNAVELERNALSAIASGTRRGTYFHAALVDDIRLDAGEQL